MLEVVVGAIVGAITGAIASIFVIRKFQYQLPRQHARIDSFKSRLYDFADLNVKYWSTTWSSQDKRNQLEMKILVAMRVLINEHRTLVKEKYSIVIQHQVEVEDLLRQLIRISSGGDFQSKNWSIDLSRPIAVARVVNRIAYKLT